MNKKFFGLSQKLENSKFDSISRFKYFVIAPTVLLVVALTLLFTVGFNKSLDFAGGTGLKVYIEQQENYTASKDKVQEVLEEKDILNAYYKTENHSDRLYLVVQFKDEANLTELQIQELNDEIVEDLFVKFGFDKEDFEERTYIVANQKFSAAVSQGVLINALMLIGIASVLAVVYLVIRFGHQMAMTGLLAIYHDILLALCLTLIFRISISTSLVPALLTIMTLSFINQVIYFGRLRENVKFAEKGHKAKELAMQTLKQTLPTQITVAIVALVLLVALNMIGTMSILSFSLISLLGLISMAYSSVLLSPALWSFVYVPAKKKKKKEKLPAEVV